MRMTLGLRLAVILRERYGDLSAGVGRVDTRRGGAEAREVPDRPEARPGGAQLDS